MKYCIILPMPLNFIQAHFCQFKVRSSILYKIVQSLNEIAIAVHLLYYLYCSSYPMAYLIISRSDSHVNM